MLIWKIKTALKIFIIVSVFLGSLTHIATSIAVHYFPISRNRYFDYQFGQDISFLDFLLVGLIIVWLLYSIVYESKIALSIFLVLGLLEYVSFINEFEPITYSNAKLNISQTLALFDVIKGSIDLVILGATLVCFFIADDERQSSSF